jgi:outer membrane protein assembly factor BamD (BamD/ComL family)
MRNVLVILVLLVTLSVAATSYGQGRAKTGPDPSTIRDSELEKDSLHNLEVARHYFKQKKAYLAALKRCEEIDAGNPTFAKMDEVLFIAGESSLRLAETGGQQKTKKVIPNSMEAKERQVMTYKTPDELQMDARIYLSRLVAEFPNSTFRSQAETDLQALGGPIAPASVEPPPVKPPQ